MQAFSFLLLLFCVTINTFSQLQAFPSLSFVEVLELYLRVLLSDDEKCPFFLFSLGFYRVCWKV